MATKEVSREVLMAILTTLGAEFTDKITQERALEKVKRIAAKKGLPDDADWNDEQKAVLTDLELLTEESEDEEKPKKKSKKGKEEKKDGKKKKAKKPKEKREGNVEKMKRLISEGKSLDEIKKIFTEDYKAAGKTDKDWIKARIEIYHNIATGTKKRKKKDKKAKKDDGEKSEKKGEGKKKKLKKKAKPEPAEESEDEDADEE